MAVNSAFAPIKFNSEVMDDSTHPLQHPIL
jgi:hypothetical protein